MSFFSIAKGFHKLTSHPPPELTQKEQDRLRAITIYEKTKDVSSGFKRRADKLFLYTLAIKVFLV